KRDWSSDVCSSDLAFFVMTWTAIFMYYSHVLEAIPLLFQGNIQQATSVLASKWLLFLPSQYGFAAYDAYVTTVENNKLYEREQRNFLKDKYQHPDFRLLKGQKVKRYICRFFQPVMV